jgi:hypothetical protein
MPSGSAPPSHGDVSARGDLLRARLDGHAPGRAILGALLTLFAAASAGSGTGAVSLPADVRAVGAVVRTSSRGVKRTTPGTAGLMPPDTDDTPDVEIAATVRGEELRFQTPPSVDVRFSNPDTSSQETTRENIDSPVEPGKLYRKARVTTRITGRL